jgi:hypothetical protein
MAFAAALLSAINLCLLIRLLRKPKPEMPVRKAEVIEMPKRVS